MYSPEQTPEILNITRNKIDFGQFNPESGDFNAEYILLSAEGEVDMLTAPYFNTEIERAINQAKHVDLDLDGIDFFSAAGIHGLVEACAIAQRNGRNITIKNPSEIVRKLMTITGVEQALPVEYDQ